MKPLFLFSTLLLICSQTIAQSRSIYIPSSATPENISSEQFKALLKDNAKTNQPEQALQEVQFPPTAMAKNSNDEAAKKKAEAKKIALTAKKDFADKIRRAWQVPKGSTGKSASVRVNLADNGRVNLADNGRVHSIIINSSDPDLKASIETAVRDAAPYPMPSDPEARKQARIFITKFIAK
ncbi:MULTISPECIES: cell envelope integrity protein TolA [unclassified Acinetobacter]|uniref:cell envelope integrity protein TolA n=1 Tax=unclassified Acinetobacter TaxID=196816 RepID=UPI0015D191F9